MAFDPVSMPAPQADCTPEQILLGEYVDPLDRIKVYSDDKFEVFIQEWAYFYLQEISDEYVRVVRFGGAGDKGRDVVGYVDESTTPPICDIYQCKHYDHGVRPSEFWPELAKLCFHVANKAIPMPRKYYIVAPQDLGPELGQLFENSGNLKERMIQQWKDTDKKNPICDSIVTGKRILLEGKLGTFVSNFDFSRIRHKPILEVIEEHRQTIRHAPRFGGGLRASLPPDPDPPADLARHETQYTGQLLKAYQDKEKNESIDFDLLANDQRLARYNSHLKRSRERFYCAETLREFARDNLPEQFTFGDVQDQVFDGVVDAAEQDYPSGYDRVMETTKVAQGVRVMNHPLQSYIKGKSLIGICHQLVNDARIYWVDNGGDNGKS